MKTHADTPHTDPADRLMLTGITATCTDCGGERTFVPVDDLAAGEFCCTSCDAAVFLLTGVGRPSRTRSHVA